MRGWLFTVIAAASLVGQTPKTIHYGSVGLAEELGTALAWLGDLDGDGHRDFAVGVPRFDPGGLPRSGRVDIVSGAPAAAAAVLRSLLAPTPAANDYFGSVLRAADFDGDGLLDLAVSAPRDNGADGAGTVYLFLGSALATGGPISPAAILSRPAGTEFGFSLAAADLSVPPDGAAELAVGSTASREVQIFRWVGGTFVQQGATISGSAFYFGYDLAFARIDGDAVPDLLVTAVTDALSIYSGTGTGPIGSPLGSGASSHYLRVAPIGDVSGDGRDEFVVGDPKAAGDFGSATVYDGATRSALASLTGSAVADGTFAGIVAGLGDVDGDSTPDFAVAHPMSGPCGQAAGTVYVFSGQLPGGGGLTLLGTLDGASFLNTSGASCGAAFGWPVVGGVDADGDGRADLLVGAPYSTVAGTYRSGAALLITNPAGVAAPPNALSITGAAGYLSVAPDAANRGVEPCGGITVEAWVNLHSAGLSGGNGSYYVVRQGPNHPDYSYQLRVYSGTYPGTSTPGLWLNWIVHTTGTGQVGVIAPMSVPFPLDTWVYVVGTYDGQQLALHQLVPPAATPLSWTAPATGTLRSGTGEFRIGKGSDAYPEFWNGRLDEIRIWPFARSAAEIVGGSTHLRELGDFPGLLAAWNLDGNGTSTTGTYAATPVGAPTFVSAGAPLLNRYPATSAFRHGWASPGTCPTTPVAALSSVPTASLGNPGFALVGACAPPATLGMVSLAFSPPPAVPLSLFGVDLWIPTTSGTTSMLVPLFSDSAGRATLPLPILGPAPALVGIPATAQFLWFSPSGSAGLIASAAVSVVLD